MDVGDSGDYGKRGFWSVDDTGYEVPIESLGGRKKGSACEGQDVGVGQREYGSEYVVGLKDNSIQNSPFRFIDKVQEGGTVLR